MSFEIRPNRIDSQDEIVALIQDNSVSEQQAIALIQANAPTPSAATPSVRGTVLGVTNTNNTAVGLYSLYSNTTGYQNTANGGYSLSSNTTGANNTANGVYSLFNNTTGAGNTASGAQSLYNNTTGYYNTAVGSYSLYYNTTGSENTANGLNSLLSNTTGYQNTANGGYSLISNTTGANNTASGFQSLYNNTTGSENTAIGQSAGYGLVNGNNNTFIGIGSQPSSSSVSDTVTLGDSRISVIRAQVTSITSLSDARDKKNIESLPTGLDFVNSLNPVKFDWNMRDGGKVDVPDTGFIAQDLVQLEDETGLAEYLKLTFRDNPDKLEASYGRLVPILVKAIQDLSNEVNTLKEQING